MRRSATLSACGRYRYDLTREWGPSPRVCWVMLNPSTADAEVDDPTIRRCVGFSRTWGFGSLVVVNLWAARATNPAELLTLADPLGPDNADAVERHVSTATLTVVAWGAHAEAMRHHGHERLRPETLAVGGARCLGITHSGHPRHPLYLPRTTPLQPFGGAT